MSSDEPWNLKDLKPEARETAREPESDPKAEASRWRKSAKVAPADVTPGMEALTNRLDCLAQQIEELSRSASHPATSPASSPAAPAIGTDISSALRSIEGRLATIDTQPIGDALTRLDRRLEALLQEGRTRSSALESRISAVDHSLAQLGRPEPATSRSFAPDAALQQPAAVGFDLGIDSALAEIERRQRALDDEARWHPEFAVGARGEAKAMSDRDGVPSVALAGLQDQLRTLTDELRNLHKAGAVEHALEKLRGELAQIGRQLAAAAPRHMLQALEAEVQALVERVDQGRSGVVDAVALASVERGLDEVRRALQQFAPAEALIEFRQEAARLNDKIESLGLYSSGGTENSADLQQLADAVAELREIARRAASEEALIALAEAVQAIGGKIDGFTRSTTGETRELSSLLEQRFQELAAHLDNRAHPAAAIVPDHLVSLVERIGDKLDRTDLGRDNSSLLDAIANQITRLAEHVEAAEARFHTLDNFERAARDLLREIGDLRASAIHAAEQAAKEMMRQSAQNTDALNTDSLRHEFDTLRQSQMQSDRRTRDTLEAVHDTLERLVDRLTVVETNLRDGSTAGVAATVLRPIEASPSLAPAATAGGATNVGLRRQQAGSTARELSVSPQARRPIDPTLPADHPLEPGTALGRSRSTASAAERIAASEAALGPVQQVPETDAKSNFIAAARRAAQAAANMSAPASAGGEAEKSATSALAALAQKFTGRRMLVLGLVLLVGAGALHLALNGVGFGGKKPTAPQTAAAVTASAPSAPAIPAVKTLPEAPERVSLPPANTPEPVRHGTQMVPSVSPLTIASIQLPSDVTGAVGRTTGVSRPAAPSPAPSDTSADELPAAFSKKLRTAALAGDPAAEYEIAARYAEGRGVPLKLEEAARWFERAANRHLTPAQYRLGSLYEKGQGVRKDLDQARRLYRAAAEKGHGKAMHNLAVLYAEGIDGKPDFKAAAEWFRKAAQRGVADSQYNLGVLYARGLGAEQNLAESYKWFELAARQGDQEAGKKRDDVGSRLDPQALVAARLAAQTFTAEPQPAEATMVSAPPGGWEDAAAPPPPAKQKSSASRRPS